MFIDKQETLFAFLPSAIGAEVGLDILFTAIGADPRGGGFGLFGSALRAEPGQDARLAAGRAGPTGIGLRLLAAAFRAELGTDVLRTAGRAIPGIGELRLRLSAAAVGAETALDVLRTALRALPALSSRGGRRSLSAHVGHLEALHHVTDLRRNRCCCSHADTEAEQIAHKAAAASAGGDGGTHITDGLGIGFLHLGLNDIFLTVTLGGH